MTTTTQPEPDVSPEQPAYEALLVYVQQVLNTQRLAQGLPPILVTDLPEAQLTELVADAERVIYRQRVAKRLYEAHEEFLVDTGLPFLSRTRRLQRHWITLATIADTDFSTVAQQREPLTTPEIYAALTRLVKREGGV